MSVPDKELPWWKAENRPDGVRCDRNGCSNVATVSVKWELFADGYRACRFHGEWWTSRTGRLVKLR